MIGRALVLLTLLLVAACGSAGPAGSEPQTGSTVHSLSDRSYRLYVPAHVTQPAPLVVMLHGGFGSADQAERSYGWDQLADTEGFVVAYPDGVGRAWNAGAGCCGRPGREGIDDVGFISAVVADVARQMPIDNARVYATGISNGGMMAYALACATDIFAAIGPDAATRLVSCPAPHPLSVLHIHGTADAMIRPDGQQGAGIAHIDGPPLADLNAFWRNVDHCDTPAVSTTGAVTRSVAACKDGRAVELVTIAGAGHQWPGGAVVRAGADPPSDAVSATSEFWRFFAAHPRM